MTFGRGLFIRLPKSLALLPLGLTNFFGPVLIIFDDDFKLF